MPRYAPLSGGEDIIQESEGQTGNAAKSRVVAEEKRTAGEKGSGGMERIRRSQPRNGAAEAGGFAQHVLCDRQQMQVGLEKRGFISGLQSYIPASKGND